MSISIDVTQGLELRDASGHSLFFKPDELVKQLMAERDRLRGELAEMQARLSTTGAERDQLREELIAVRRERDEYIQWVYALSPKPTPMTDAEVAELRKNGIPVEQTLAEVEQIIHGVRNG